MIHCRSDPDISATSPPVIIVSQIFRNVAEIFDSDVLKCRKKATYLKSETGLESAYTSNPHHIWFTAVYQIREFIIVILCP